MMQGRSARGLTSGLGTRSVRRRMEQCWGRVEYASCILLGGPATPSGSCEVLEPGAILAPATAGCGAVGALSEPACLN